MEMMASLGKFETLKFSRVAQIGNRDFGKWPETRVFILLRYYRELRNRLFQSVSAISTVSLYTLLFGDETLTLADNEKIFSAVHSYIVDTDRFRS